MKRMITWLMIIVLCLGFVGCEKIELPEGVTDKEFYKDMIKCLELTEKALKNKNFKYTDDIKSLIEKHTTKGIIEILFDSNKYNKTAIENINLNEKESEIAVQAISIYLNLNRYLDFYFNNSNIDTKVLVDINTEEGNKLYKDIQKLITLLEIDYEIKTN